MRELELTNFYREVYEQVEYKSYDEELTEKEELSEEKELTEKEELSEQMELPEKLEELTEEDKLAINGIVLSGFTQLILLNLSDNRTWFNNIEAQQ